MLLCELFLLEGYGGTFYHITLTKNLPDILQHGLIPKVGERSALIKETKPAIYLFGSFTDVENALYNWLGDEFEDDTLALLKVELPRNIRVEKVAFEYQVFNPIPPDCLTVISENIDDFDFGSEFSHLKSSVDIEALRPQIIIAAQKIYDDWDEEDVDTYANGGICHFIADEIANILGHHGILCSTVSSMNEQHVYVVAQCSDGIFEVDIPYRTYEHGGGFSWTKIPNVKFTNDYIIIHKLSNDPSDMKDYMDEREE